MQEYNFEEFNVTPYNKIVMQIAKDYLNKCIENKQNKGLIITGESGVGKTHVAVSIANELIKHDKIVLMGRLSVTAQ